MSQKPTMEDFLQALPPHLSMEEGRTTAELVQRAGYPHSCISTATRALTEMMRNGSVKKAKVPGHSTAWLLCKPKEKEFEEVSIEGLDAVISITYPVQTSPSSRTPLILEAVLGPSWPKGTQPPTRWSTTPFATSGGVESAKQRGLTYFHDKLLSLRETQPQEIPLPTPEPSPAPPPTPAQSPDSLDMASFQAFRKGLLAYCASIEKGANHASLVSWLQTKGFYTAQTADAYLNHLVADGTLHRFVTTLPNGELVTRYKVIPPVVPAPLPKSDAPPTIEAAPEEVPVVAPPPTKEADPPPCARCAELEEALNREDQDTSSARLELVNLLHLPPGTLLKEIPGKVRSLQARLEQDLEKSANALLNAVARIDETTQAHEAAQQELARTKASLQAAKKSEKDAVGALAAEKENSNNLEGRWEACRGALDVARSEKARVEELLKSQAETVSKLRGAIESHWGEARTLKEQHAEELSRKDKEYQDFLDRWGPSGTERVALIGELTGARSRLSCLTLRVQELESAKECPPELSASKLQEVENLDGPRHEPRKFTAEDLATFLKGLTPVQWSAVVEAYESLEKSNRLLQEGGTLQSKAIHHLTHLDEGAGARPPPSSGDEIPDEQTLRGQALRLILQGKASTSKDLVALTGRTRSSLGHDLIELHKRKLVRRIRPGVYGPPLPKG